MVMMLIFKRCFPYVFDVAWKNSMLTSKYFLVYNTYNTKILIENVKRMLKTKISNVLIKKMLVKPIRVKTHNEKFWPLGPFSHDPNQMFILKHLFLPFIGRKFFMHQTVFKQWNDIVNTDGKKTKRQRCHN